MRIASIVMVMILLVGCKVEQTIGDNYYTDRDFSYHCIGGVVYMTRDAGSKAFMAPKFNPETKEVVACNE